MDNTLGIYDSVRKLLRKDLNEKLNIMNGLIPAGKVIKQADNLNGQKRNKRSPLDFIRTISKNLFGTATVKDVETIKSHIIALETNPESFKGFRKFQKQLSSLEVEAHENLELLQDGVNKNKMLINESFHEMDRLQYYTLRNILDKHAPVHECKTPQHVNKGFINSEILAAKRRKRKLEREWRRDNSAINRSRYRAAVNHFNCLVECAKTKYYSDMVTKNEDNPKALWNSIKKVLHRSPKMVLPDYTTMNSLVNTFGRYFADKNAKLRSGLLSTDVDPPASGSYKNKFVSFWTMSEEEVLKIIKSTPNKSCDLDPIPTSLVLDCISVLLTPITNIVNYSLQEGSFPSCFKTAHVTPLLKKAGLDKNILKNYRPVSNLSYISKLIEKAVARQINEHIAHEGISNENQSAYRVFHSTETALLKIQNDIATSMDKGAAVGLVLLDLSAAFDTHTV